MPKIANLFANRIINQEPIGIFGDYDVDGATSSALLARFFSSLGCQAEIFIPDRLDDGYGPNLEALKKLAANGAKTIVTVDCGSTAFVPLEEAAKLGIEIAIIDHHACEAIMPKCIALINPKRLDEEMGHTELAAVGVVFLTIVATNKILRDKGFYNNRPEPNLFAWLDLVALGTLCDMAPLIRLNRAYVSQGLKIMNQKGNTGIMALAEVSGISETLKAYHLGFVLGPRLNAPGRVGFADCGARLLFTDNKDRAKDLAGILNQNNLDRQIIEAEVLEQADKIIATGKYVNENFILVVGHDWHQGVIGIVASRLKEKYNRVICVVTISGSTAKGSGRSILEVDLGEMVISARQIGLLNAGGGHHMAAGFSVNTDRIDELYNFFNDHITAQLKGEKNLPKLEIDGLMTLDGANISLAKQLDLLEPYGSANMPPKFAFLNIKVVKAEIVGNGHVRAILTDAMNHNRIKAIAFKSAETPIGQTLLKSNGQFLHIAGRLKAENYQGRESVQINIEDVAMV